MKFSAFKTPAALAVALFAATAHAGFPDNADGSTNRALKGGNDEKKAKGTKAKSTTAAKQKKTHADDDEVDFIIKWKDEVGHQELANYATDRKVKDISGRQHLSTVHTNYSNLKSLKENPHIESVEEDFEVHALPFFRGEEFNRRLAESVPYGITMVQANKFVFAGAPGSDPIKICVIDTGYDINHDDLPQEGVTGFSPYGAGEEWNGDGHGHGTHCAGTIGAIGYNDVGVTSVNPYPDRFRFHIGKGLRNSGSGTTSNVLLAVENCADAGAKVISMSLGGGAYSQAAQDLYTRLYEEEGVLIIAAAGNDGNSGLSYPASYDNVMSVAAVDSNENRAGFSQYNEQVEIAGPGVGVQSTLPGNSYAAWSGTSMATPHVAGVAALVWSYFPDCTSENIRTVLLLTAKDKGATDCDPQYGYGIVQAKAAYDLLETDGCGAGDVDALAAKKRSCAFPPVPPPPCTAGSCTGHCEYCNADQVCEAAACTDNPLGWYDSDGPTYDCDWYALGSNCAVYGDSYANFGKTANQVCCACEAGTCDATPPPIFPPTPPPTTPPTPPPTTPPTPYTQSVLGETGNVRLGDTIDMNFVATVYFRHEYTDPVVVAFINTRNGDQSVSVRVKQVTSTECQLFMQAPDNENHADEWVSYIVMEAGRHTLDGGIVVEAGKTETAIIHKGSQDFIGHEVTFEQAFSSTPAVLHTLNTYDNNDFMASLVTDVNAANFEVAMEAAETSKSSNGEYVGWIAFASASGTTNGKPFYIGSGSEPSKDGRDNNTPHTINYSSMGFSRSPDIVVSVYGENGRDGSWARGAGTWSTTEQKVYAEEDQVLQSERRHTNEPFAWAAFGSNTDFYGSASAAFIAASSGSVCGNGKCEGDESVRTCPFDCFEGTLAPTPGPVDDDNVCLGYGEPCETSDECCEHCDGAGLCA